MSASCPRQTRAAPFLGEQLSLVQAIGVPILMRRKSLKNNGKWNPPVNRIHHIGGGFGPVHDLGWLDPEQKPPERPGAVMVARQNNSTRALERCYTERHKFLRIALERRSLRAGIVASICDRRRRSGTAATFECANICVARYSSNPDRWTGQSKSTRHGRRRSPPEAAGRKSRKPAPTLCGRSQRKSAQTIKARSEMATVPMA